MDLFEAKEKIDKQRQIIIEYWMRTLLDQNYSLHIIPIMVTFAQDIDDRLKLSQNEQVKKMLTKIGDNFPEKERVILSEQLIKINKRGKEIPRIFLVTDKAIYILKEKWLPKCMRRTDITTIAQITVSTTFDEICINIPEEYDYHYKSKNKQVIVNIIAEIYRNRNKNNKKLTIKNITKSTVYDQGIGKTIRRLQSRQQVLNDDVSFAIDNIHLSTPSIDVKCVKDVTNFRKCIRNGKMPSINSITYDGLLNEYYLDRMNDDNKDNMKQSMLFYPTFCYTKTLKLNSKMNYIPNEYEYYMLIGLNSNIKQNPINVKRKHFNLVILLDKSGSMSDEYRDVQLNFTGNVPVSYTYISKMRSVINGTLLIIKQLTNNDKLAIVTFDSYGTVLQDLNNVNNINMNTLKSILSYITPGGDTNFENGFNTAYSLLNTITNNTQYDNRIIILTDTQPNNLLLKIVEKCAQNPSNRVYTTFVGVGLDFNTYLVETISSIRGCNYYAVQSNEALAYKINYEFEYMVTPLVFNICLKFNVDVNVCKIDKIYGKNIKINTLFGSKYKTTTHFNGRIQLMKFTKLLNNNDNINVLLEVSFEDKNNKKYLNKYNYNVIFNSISINNDINKRIRIRKAILLCKYVELIKKWIKSESNSNSSILKISNDCKELFTNFLKHFAKEMNEFKDNTLQKEMDIIHKIANIN